MTVNRLLTLATNPPRNWPVERALAQIAEILDREVVYTQPLVRTRILFFRLTPISCRELPEVSCGARGRGQP